MHSTDAKKEERGKGEKTTAPAMAGRLAACSKHSSCCCAWLCRVAWLSCLCSSVLRELATIEDFYSTAKEAVKHDGGDAEGITGAERKASPRMKFRKRNNGGNSGAALWPPPCSSWQQLLPVLIVYGSLALVVVPLSLQVFLLFLQNQRDAGVAATATTALSGDATAAAAATATAARTTTTLAASSSAKAVAVPTYAAVRTSYATGNQQHQRPDLALPAPESTIETGRPFPRWGFNDNDDEGSGGDKIDIGLLVEFVRGVLSESADATTPTTLTGTGDRKYIFPEVPYVVELSNGNDKDAEDSSGIYVSGRIRQRMALVMIGSRVKPTELILLRAFQKLQKLQRQQRIRSEVNGNTKNATASVTDDSGGSLEDGTTRWPNLRRLFVSLSEQRNISRVGFPFFVWYGDYKSCNYRNWKKIPIRASHPHPPQQHGGPTEDKSIPLFTTCGRIDCHHGWPIPTYKTIASSMPTSEGWNTTIDEYARMYPWHNKTRKVVWRGSLSGALRNYTSPRARIGAFIARYGEANDHIMDMGITGIPDHNVRVDLTRISTNGTLAPPIKPMSNFQWYIGILDIDGNSWSSRFGSLLCYNSVVLKVKPSYVDYFFLQPDLLPWRHYVPIAPDLSDLLDKMKWVVDPANDAAVRQIVANANDWCRRRMTHESIVDDVLDIWDRYVQYLAIDGVHNKSSNSGNGGFNWIPQWSAAYRNQLFSDAPESLRLTKLESPPRLIYKKRAKKRSSRNTGSTRTTSSVKKKK